MNKKIYAFELDSVCNSTDEINYVLDNVVFKTIVVDGDILVLSLNQLADSTFIISCIKDNDMRKVLMELIKFKRIIVNPYGKYFTAVQYINDKIDSWIKNKNSDFIFSIINCLNISDENQREFILKNLQNCLRNCDLKTFKYNLENKKTELKITDQDINFLVDYAEFLILISLEDICDTDRYNKRENKANIFRDCINIAVEVLQERESTTLLAEKLTSLRKNIESSFSKNTDKDSRSNWIKLNKSDKNMIACVNQEDKKCLNEIETIINVCYNLTIENSIEGMDSITTVKDNTFSSDVQPFPLHENLLSCAATKAYFLKRYQMVKNLYEKNHHIYYKEDGAPSIHIFSDKQKKNWRSIIRCLSGVDFKNYDICWEEKIKKAKKAKGWNIIKKFLISTLILFFINFFIGSLQNLPSIFLEQNTLCAALYAICEKIISLKILLNFIIPIIFILLAVFLSDMASSKKKLSNTYDLLCGEDNKQDRKTFKRLLLKIKEKERLSCWKTTLIKHIKCKHKNDGDDNN